MDELGSLPRAQTLSESGIEKVPLQYVRPNLEHSKPHNTGHVPVIDLLGLEASHLEQETIAEISKAAKDWGFFQIINNGVSNSLISRIQEVGKAFFNLPIEEKELYRNEKAGSPIGYGSKLGYTQYAKLDWGDYYYNVILPPHRRNMSKQPSDFTEVMDEYSREMYKLWEVLMVLSRGLGLEDENIVNEAVGGEKKEIHIRMKYYPPCPQPEMVLGISPHSDPHVLTFLLHDETPGLQIGLMFKVFQEPSLLTLLMHLR